MGLCASCASPAKFDPSDLQTHALPAIVRVVSAERQNPGPLPVFEHLTEEGVQVIPKIRKATCGH